MFAIRSVAVCVTTLLFLSGCQSDPSTNGATVQGSVQTLPGVRYVADAAWTAVPPSSQARAAQYTLASPTASGEPAELIFYYFGREGAGSIEANLERWAGQFEQAGGGAVSTKVWTRYGLRVHEVAINGRYVAETSPGSGERHNKPDYAMRAAIVETKAGPYYVRMTGPRAVVEHWQPSWQRLLDSLRPAPVETSAVEDAAVHSQPAGGQVR